MNGIAEKISKLIAKADSTSHPEEADAFMARAHKMLEEHGLSLLDLGRLGSDDPVDGSHDVYRASEGWKAKIAFQLAVYYGCELVVTRTGKAASSYSVFGRESARITFQLMAPFVFRQVTALANKQCRRGVYHSRQVACNQLAGALAVRLYRLIKERQAGETRVTSGVNALVPVDLIRQARDEAFPKARPSTMKHSHDYNAQEVAKRVSLNQQTPAPASAMKLAAQ